ncbi:MAG: AMP-binding protein [Mucispirillum sp.]|nr:AMP-binding protein [Mucispirillum sp.]
MITNLIEYFENTTANINAEKTAVIDNDKEYSFKYIRDNSKKIATYLLSHNIAVYNKPAAVFLDKSVNVVIANVAAIYSCMPYMNMDTKTPIYRISNIIEQVNPAFIITNTKYEEKIKEIFNGVIINIDTFDFNIAINEEVIKQRQKYHIDTNPLCIINTSGSTGTPKSVVLNHRSFFDFMAWSFETMPFTENEVIGSLSPVVFDIYSFELCLMMAKSSTIMLIPDNMAMFPVKILELIEKYKATFLFWVPTIMVNIANMELFNKADLSSIKLIWFAGEVFPTKQLNIWRKNLSGAMFVNMYGPIEITLDCTYFIVDRDFADDEALPIGYPCRNSDILILDDDKEAANGEDGELCVRGTSLAMGYYNNPEKTRAAFVQNPLNPYYPELIYRTGDIVCKNSRGEIMFKGRKDTLIKHLGYRIELGEIEHIIVSVLKIVDNVCVMYNKNKKEIICIYENDDEITMADFRKKIGDALPKYMMPTRYIHTLSMPRNTNGKIDRNTLKLQYIGE